MTECVVVMGVSGSGKTTVAEGIAETMGWAFADADSFHSPTARAKMQAGTPLTDADRQPWLERVRAWMDERHDEGQDAVVACSALRRSYREVLAQARSRVRFCHVDVTADVLADRLARRQDHFMPASLLASQLATLEPLADGERGVVVDGSGPRDVVLEAALAALGLDPRMRGA